MRAETMFDIANRVADSVRCNDRGDGQYSIVDAISFNTSSILLANCYANVSKPGKQWADGSRQVFSRMPNLDRWAI